MKCGEDIVRPVLFISKLSLKRSDDWPTATQGDSFRHLPGLETHNAVLWPTGTLPTPSLKVIRKPLVAVGNGLLRNSVFPPAS